MPLAILIPLALALLVADTPPLTPSATATGGPGKVGLYSDLVGVSYVLPRMHTEERRLFAGRWDHGGSAWTHTSSTYNGIDPAADKWFGAAWSRPVLIEGVRAERFRMTFEMDSGFVDVNQRMAVVFNATDSGDMDYIDFWEGAPQGVYQVDNGERSAVAATTSSIWTYSANPTWVRLEQTGSAVTMKMIHTGSAPSEAAWSSATVVVSTSNFDMAGGRIGFMATAGGSKVDNLTLQTDRDANGSYETVEHIDHFTVDANGHADIQPTYDAAGNLAYDGSLVYTYDAWNRLVKVTKAYRDPTSGNVTLGSVIAEHEYDGLHRRIVRQVKNSADLDGTFHDYYDGQSVIETRNGSDLVLKQQVWGVTYIDELVQVAVNGDPVDDPEFDPADGDHDPHYYYAVHNANYNVQLLVDATGVAVERYEYAPYGERTVYTSPGSNDPDCHAPTLLPQRVNVAGTAQPYAICDVGFQGKQHDDVSGLIVQGRRYLHPRFARFINRDILHYPDGLNGYAAYFVLWSQLDPTGLQSKPGKAFGRSAIAEALAEVNNDAEGAREINRQLIDNIGNSVVAGTEGVVAGVKALADESGLTSAGTAIAQAAQGNAGPAIAAAIVAAAARAIPGGAAALRKLCEKGEDKYFRGIPKVFATERGRLKYENAQRGLAVPDGAATDPNSLVKHIEGDPAIKSGVTSWSADRNAAKAFSGKNGIILEVDRSSVADKVKPAPPNAPIKAHEKEVLLEGTIHAKPTQP